MRIARDGGRPFRLFIRQANTLTPEKTRRSVIALCTVGLINGDGGSGWSLSPLEVCRVSCRAGESEVKQLLFTRGGDEWVNVQWRPTIRRPHPQVEESQRQLRRPWQLCLIMPMYRTISTHPGVVTCSAWVAAAEICMMSILSLA